MAVKRIGIIAFSIFLIFATARTSLSAEKAKGKAAKTKDQAPKKTSLAREVQGEVTGIDSNTISILYSRTYGKGKNAGGSEKEIVLPFDKGVELVHLKSVKQIAIGDIVSVRYLETVEDGMDGRMVSRKAGQIAFIKQAPIEMQSTVLGAEGYVAPSPSGDEEEEE